MIDFAKMLPSMVVQNITATGLGTMGLSPGSPQMVGTFYRLSPSTILIQTETFWTGRGQ